MYSKHINKGGQNVSKKMWRWVAAAIFLVMFIINGIAGATTLLNGQNTADVSATYPTLFTPAGYVFAIWGVIYLLVFLYTLFQLGWLGKISGKKDKAITKLTPYFVALSVVNTVWIFAWQYNVIWLATLLIITMLVMLIKINEVLYKLDFSKREKWLMKYPFSVYFGWLTVATVANIAVWLVSVNWDGWGISPNSWLVGILWVAAAVGVVAALRNKDWLYGTVFVWAYAGILVKHLSHGIDWQNDSGVVLNLIFLIVALAGVTGYLYRLGKAKD